MTEEFYSEADYDKRRRERLAQMKRLKEKQMQQRRRLKVLVPAVLVAALVVGIGVNALSGKSQEKKANTNAANTADKGEDAASTAMSNM